MFVIKAIHLFCRYHSHLLCQHIQTASALRMQLFYIHFSYIVHTVMEWVACKSPKPMPLQAQMLYIFPAYAMVFFLKILVDHKSWQSPRALPFPLASEKAFSCVFHGNLLCHCKHNGIHFSNINVLMTVGKT